MAFLRIREGQIVEAWNNFDFATMNAQLSPHTAIGEHPRNKSTDSDASG
jgi:hypothetical protein